MRIINIKKTVIITVLSLLIVVVSVLGILFYTGVLLLNDPSRDSYPVRGVDVSSYQGEIDWHTLSSQNISFAFIKATEGSSFADPCFEYNFSEAQKCEIAVGAYHFFSYDSPGATQAENFIKTVNPFEGMLPPVIDLEFYGDKKKDPPNREYVSSELKDMLTALEDYYGLKPIIYATELSYKLYLSEEYAEYDIWIRNVLTSPTLSDGRQWTFWQYADRETLDGYNGKEKHIDMNVFNGSCEEFALYPKYKTNTGKIGG